MNKITILGSGTSTGVPILGCKCQVCQSTDPRNKRLRTSALIELQDKKRILIDATPDLRTQLLRENIDDVNAVIITHDHADHTHGMDDLRPFGFKHQRALPVYTNVQTSDALKSKFPYIFDRQKVYADKPVLGGGIPLLDLKILHSSSEKILDQDFEFYPLPHGHESTLSILHSKMGYITDCREIPSSVLDHFKKAQLEVLLIDCLRLTPHQTHLHLDQTLEYISYLRPKISVLIHLGHELSHENLWTELRTRSVKNVSVGVDGQSFFYS